MRPAALLLHAARSVFFVLLGLCAAAPALGQQTFTVTTNADAGAGSLRAAIEAANATSERDSIAFAIGGGGSYQVIALESALTATAPVALDGDSQACDRTQGLCVRLDGAAYDDAPGIRLRPNASGSRVSNLVFTRFSPNVPDGFGALSVISSRNVVTGNHFGVDRTGLVTDPDGAPGNADDLANGYAILVASDSLDGMPTVAMDNRIGGVGVGNVVAARDSTHSSIVLRGSGASGTIVSGNFIGVGPDGATLLGAGLFGLRLTDSTHTNVIGGDSREAGNLLIGAKSTGLGLFNSNNNTISHNVASGNPGGGMQLSDGSDRNIITNNRIGTTPDGMSALPNGTIAGLPAFEGRGLLIESGNDNLVRRNVISGNLLLGVLLGGLRPGEVRDNSIVDNLIGVDASGQAALPNGIPGVPDIGFGVVFFGQAATVVDNVVAKNTISGNTTSGVLFDGPNTTNNIVAENNIGSSQDDDALPNGQAGVIFRIGAHHNIVGGSDDDYNVIFHNPFGILLLPGTGVGNRIAGNDMGSASFDVDLGADGPTANDAGDADDGPNRLQNYAEVSSVDVDGDALTVTFRVDTDAANAAYPLALHLYSIETEDDAPFLASMSTTVPYEEGEAGTTVTRMVTLDEADQDSDLTFRQFRFAVVDADGNTSEVSLAPVAVALEEGTDAPTLLALAPSRPNPFADATEIAYTLPSAGHVRLSVYDLLGRQIAVLVDAPRSAGAHVVTLSANGLPSGAYVYRLITDQGTRTRTVVLAR